MKKITNRILIYLNQIFRFSYFFKANKFVKDKHPEIQDAFMKFRTLGQISSNRQPIKGYDLWNLLLKFKPNNIVELGSGTTSVIFALYSKLYNKKFIAFESFEKWRDVTIECVADISSDDIIIYNPSQNSKDMSATHFTKPIPNDVEFLYIDGPPCLLPNGKKVPNDDIIIAFENKIFPNYIVIDGRHETVDLILNHKFSSQYNFYPSFSYSLYSKKFRQAIYFREHSLFQKLHI
jgi:hypothetical protein